ncbi:MAG: hypothetical protein MUO26_04335 [Methanotrichaceae archaeon]|nr:hypothetical protein [Methanotrichaceae archaeon]
MTKGYPDKKRYAYIYCNSIEEKKRFEKLAKEAGVSTSKFLLNAIEIGLNPSEESVSSNAHDIEQELEKTRDELRIARILLEKYQEELRKANEAAPSLHIDRDLLELFKKSRRPLSEKELYGLLTSPQVGLYIIGDGQELSRTTEPEIHTIDIEAIAKQLETLEKLGLISKFADGWCWNG